MKLTDSLLADTDTFVSFSETKIQADTALASLSQSMAKVNMMEMDKEEEEEIYQSTKFWINSDCYAQGFPHIESVVI